VLAKGREHPLVNAGALLLQEGLVDRVLNQRVLEGVERARRFTLNERELAPTEPVENACKAPRRSFPIRLE
jgi:hypothetical protein